MKLILEGLSPWRTAHGTWWFECADSDNPLSPILWFSMQVINSKFSQHVHPSQTRNCTTQKAENDFPGKENARKINHIFLIGTGEVKKTFLVFQSKTQKHQKINFSHHFHPSYTRNCKNQKAENGFPGKENARK